MSLLMKRSRILPWLVIALGIMAMILGAYRGEVKTMFEKAINICLECIGIG